jgi:hypothetical protein
VERCFEDQKTELGFDHFEGRTYVGLMRHQIISAVTHLFLSRMQLQLREKKTGSHGVPSTNGCSRIGPELVAAQTCRHETHRENSPPDHTNPATQRRGSSQSSQARPRPPARKRNSNFSPAKMQNEENLAL